MDGEAWGEGTAPGARDGFGEATGDGAGERVSEDGAGGAGVTVTGAGVAVPPVTGPRGDGERDADGARLAVAAVAGGSCSGRTSAPRTVPCDDASS